VKAVSQPGVSVLAVLSLLAAPLFAAPTPGRSAPEGGEASWRVVNRISVGRGPGVPARATCAAFSPDGRFAAVGTGDGAVHLRDGRTGKPVRTITTDSFVEALAFSRDARALAGAANNRVTVWEVPSGKLRWEAVGGRGDADRMLFEPSVAFTPDGRTLVVAGQRDMTVEATAGVVALLDARTGRVQRALIAGGEPVNGVAVSPDGRRIAAVTGAFESEHPEVFVWDRETGEEAWVGRADAGPLFSVAFSPDGSTLAVGGRSADGGSVGLWDAGSGALERSLPHGETALAAAFSPDGRSLATAGLEGAVKVWDPRTGEMMSTLHGAKPPFAVFSVAFAPNGRFLTAGDDGSVTEYGRK